MYEPFLRLPDSSTESCSRDRFLSKTDYQLCCVYIGFRHIYIINLKLLFIYITQLLGIYREIFRFLVDRFLPPAAERRASRVRPGDATAAGFQKLLLSLFV